MSPRRYAVLLWVLLPAVAAPRAGAESAKHAPYWLSGKIVTTDKALLRGASSAVVLESVETPFVTSSVIRANGQFSIRDLMAGLYVLTIYVPHTRPAQHTVEIGPTRAGPSGRVSLEVRFERRPPLDAAFTVSVHQLTVSMRARAEFDKVEGLLRRRRIDEARARLRNALTLAPRYSAAWTQLGMINYLSGRLEEAEDCMREGLRWGARYYAPLIGLGGVLLARGKYEEALQVNLEAVAARPYDPLAQSRLGQSYFHLGDLERAEVHLRKAKELEPGHYSFPQLLLARIHERRREPEGVLRELEEFLRIHPDASQAGEVRRTLEDARNQVATDDGFRQPGR